MQTKMPESVERTRDARLEARVSSEQKALLQQAASLTGRTLSEFVVASAIQDATRVVREHDAIKLSKEAQMAFVSALLDPPPPNARLQQAMARYRRAVGR